MKIKLIFLMVLGLLNVQSVLVAQDEKVHCRRVDQERLKLAMETVKEKNTVPGGKPYDPTITTNGIRYQTDVIVDLIEEAMQGHEQSEDACLLFINYKDWYEAFVRVNCQNREVPEYVIEANGAEQNMVIDYNRRKVIEKIDRDDPDTPDIAANVALYWKAGKKRFSYEADYSDPKLEVINERRITYRLLKYNKDNLIVCDRIEGLRGRAKEGFLKYLGKARMIHYRIVPVKGGPQYVRMVTKKWFIPWKNDLTINLKGKTLDGIPNKKIKQAKKIEQAKKAKKILQRKINIQYKHSSEDLDYLLKTSDQLAELDCNNGNS